MDTYLSYTHADNEIAKRLASDLSSSDIDVWLDVENLEPGESIFASISHAVRKSKNFIALISKKSAESTGLASELATALAAKEADPDRLIIPVIIDSSSEMPSFLRDFFWLDMSSEEKYNENFPHLVKTLENRPTHHKIIHLDNEEFLKISVDTEQIIRVEFEEFYKKRRAERSDTIRSNIGSSFVVALLSILTILFFLGTIDKIFPSVGMAVTMGIFVTIFVIGVLFGLFALSFIRSALQIYSVSIMSHIGKRFIKTNRKDNDTKWGDSD